MKNSLWETAKFVARTVFLVGVPAVIAQLVKEKPEWGAWLGIAALVVDKLIHENKNVKANGLLPF
jgi:hypothetical protein